MATTGKKSNFWQRTGKWFCQIPSVEFYKILFKYFILMMYLWGGLYMGMGILGVVDYHNHKVEYEKQNNVKFQDYMREIDTTSVDSIPYEQIYVNLAINKSKLENIFEKKKNKEIY